MPQSDGAQDSLPGGEESPLGGTFNLQVVSPSVGVSGPLTFPQLPSATTIKQLKEKIRNALPMQPSDEHQRLIHRGRLLARENETMSDVFGAETLKVSEMHTLHLVLRPSGSDSPAPQNITSAPNLQDPPQPRAPMPPLRMPGAPPLPDSIQQLLDEHHARNRDLARSPTPPSRLSTPPAHLGHGQQVQFQQAQNRQRLDQQIQQSMQRLQQLEQDRARILQEQTVQHQLLNVNSGMPGTPPQAQQDNPGHVAPLVPSFQNLIAQHQRDRAAMGMQGAHVGGHPIPHAGQMGTPPVPGRVTYRPQGTRTTTQEFTAPNGDRYHVTLNETTTTTIVQGNAPQASSVGEVQHMLHNIARAVDGNTGARTSRQPATQTNLPWNPLAAAIADGGINRPASAPPLERVIPTSGTTVSTVQAPSQHVALTLTPSSNASVPTTPVVYILSSPTGPQGLLVSPSENGFETFFTPRRPAHPSLQRQQPPNPPHGQVLPETRQRREGRVNRHAQRHAEAGGRAAAALAHPANPPAGPVAARILPHVWLVVRLLGFVWFFTSGNTSWWRLFMVSGVAFILFLVGTGIFNGIAEDIWGPIRRHLEALLPLAGANGPEEIFPAPPAAGAGAPAHGQVGAAAGQVRGAPNIPPDPAQAAARLVEQRRHGNENWIWTQIRRIEHATILFLASLVPGVGERHIAARAAADELLQRARQEANNIAARTAEALAAEDTVTENGSQDGATSTMANGDGSGEPSNPAENVPTVDASVDTTAATGENQDGEVRNAEPPNSAPVERLVEL